MPALPLEHLHLLRDSSNVGRWRAGWFPLGDDGEIWWRGEQTREARE
jgi:hypothetical protein